MEKRRILMAGGTLCCVLGIGYFLQSNSDPRPIELQQDIVTQSVRAEANLQVDLTPARVTEKPNFVVDADPLNPVVSADGPLVIDEITHTAAKADDEVGFKTAGTSNSVMELPKPPADPEIPQLGCQGKVMVRSASAANIHVEIDSPCRPNERLTIHHSGLMFTVSTDAEGKFSAMIPALKELAIIIVDFASGEDVVATAQVPEIGKYDRVAVQWSGDNGFEIHAREFGAGYGQAGHVWSGNAGTRKSTGTMVKLGDAQLLNPKLVEIYTFPRGEFPQEGSVVLSVETEVTLANCGKEISAQALELRDGKSLRTRDMFLSMPNCSAVGDFLVLNNLIDDLKIASN